ncbi:MAG: NADH-quinone oxidoreductase subunit NuoK [Anaerolineales bacterium]
MDLQILPAALLAVIGLVGVGLYGLLMLRNLIKLIVAIQLMVKGVLLAFVIAGQSSGQPDLAQTFGLTVLVADTVVAVIGLALAVQIRRRLGTLDVADLARLKG